MTYDVHTSMTICNSLQRTYFNREREKARENICNRETKLLLNCIPAILKTLFLKYNPHTFYNHFFVVLPQVLR